MTDTFALKADGLFKKFGKHADSAVRKLRSGSSKDVLPGGNAAAVIDPYFEVKRGEIFVVMGLCGSGKSTLIRMLNGLHEVPSGTVTIGNQEVTNASNKEMRAYRRTRMSMTFQHFALLSHRTVLDNVAYGLEI